MTYIFNYLFRREITPKTLSIARLEYVVPNCMILFLKNLSPTFTNVLGKGICFFLFSNHGTFSLIKPIE